jgi:predicted unusual protein kinase regulating ubiquinone biosynthesis (AarF/ABC1/UbiB family)
VVVREPDFIAHLDEAAVHVPAPAAPMPDDAPSDYMREQARAVASTVRGIMNPEAAAQPQAARAHFDPFTMPMRRSLKMQVRFFRIIAYFGLLFGRLLFWHWFLARYAPRFVERGQLRRWQGYARGFRGFAIEMGGVMIKAGQFISTRSDILPPEITNELASLRDEVPSVPTRRIRAILEREIGPIARHFAQFDDTPIGAASLGQVHRARLYNGDKVVVKVQRPGIDEICYTDLAATDVVMHIAMRFRFVSRRMDAVALLREFGRVLIEELSYRLEADNNARFAAMFAQDMGVYIPAVYRELSTDRVLVMEDVSTIKLDDYAALEKAGISRKAVAKRLADTYFRQIFGERFFHADPHPGNLFIYPLSDEQAQYQDAGDGRPFYLIFIDFGMTASLTPQIISGLIGTLAAVTMRDSRRLIESYSKLGFILPGADLDRLEEATRAVFDQVWGLDMSEMRNVSMDSMSRLSQEFNDLLFSMPFQVPQDFIYLGRTVSILSGLTTSLDPNYNPWAELQPYTQKMAVESGALGEMAGGLVGGLAGNLINLPVVQSLFNGAGGKALLGLGQSILGRASTADQVLARLESGDLRLRVEAAGGLNRQLARVEAHSRRTTRAVVFGSSLVASTLFYTSGDALPALIGFAFTAWCAWGLLWDRPEAAG